MALGAQLAVAAVGAAVIASLATHVSLGWGGMTFGVMLLSALSPLMLVAHYAVPVSCGWLITAGFMAVSRPSGPFDPDSAPAPLDYALASAWHALPWRDDPADIAPCALLARPGASANDPCGDGKPGRWRQQPQEHLPADVFFLPPTSFYSPAGWNAPAHEPLADFIVGEGLFPQLASALNGAGRVFSPRFRQMTATGFWDRTDGADALALAYSDVREAFLTYLQRWGGSRPLILAGHSQGTAHAMRLLVEEIAPRPELCERLVVAYLPGMPVFESALRTALATHGAAAGCALTQRPVCSSAEQTGCVASWRTYHEGGDPSQFLEQPPPLPKEWQEEEGEAPLCVNPLTWAVGAQGKGAGREANRGSVSLFHPSYNWQSFLHAGVGPEHEAEAEPADVAAELGKATVWEEQRVRRMEGFYGPLRSQVCGAVCGEDGGLYATPPPRYWHSLLDLPGLWHMVLFPGANAHSYDYQLYYAAVRENAGARVESFLRRGEVAEKKAAEAAQKRREASKRRESEQDALTEAFRAQGAKGPGRHRKEGQQGWDPSAARGGASKGG